MTSARLAASRSNSLLSIGSRTDQGEAQLGWEASTEKYLNFDPDRSPEIIENKASRTS
jgi:hypothetical protein